MQECKNDQYLKKILLQTQTSDSGQYITGRNRRKQIHDNAHLEMYRLRQNNER
nr:MAG TPA: hypothetical protein [Caudoviricetes sp.]DAO53173.1 MAG TPA: hypothetical protein [Caudoviricetes sp.]